MSCTFPQCILNCTDCSEYNQDNTLNDNYLDYIEDNHADTYLCSMEAHEVEYIDYI